MDLTVLRGRKQVRQTVQRRLRVVTIDIVDLEEVKSVGK